MHAHESLMQPTNQRPVGFPVSAANNRSRNNLASRKPKRAPSPANRPLHPLPTVCKLARVCTSSWRVNEPRRMKEKGSLRQFTKLLGYRVLDVIERVDPSRGHPARNYRASCAHDGGHQK